MKKIKIIYYIVFILISFLFFNISSALFTPKDQEELKKEYEYLTSIRGILTDEEQEIVKKYEDFIEFEREAEESYQKRLKEELLKGFEIEKK